jgi:hypothetical protein
LWQNTYLIVEVAWLPDEINPLLVDEAPHVFLANLYPAGLPLHGCADYVVAVTRVNTVIFILVVKAVSIL